MDIFKGLKGIRKVVVSFMFLLFTFGCILAKAPTEFWTGPFKLVCALLGVFFVSNLAEYIKGFLELIRK